MAGSSSNDFPHRRGRGPFKGMHDITGRRSRWQNYPRFEPWRVRYVGVGLPCVRLTEHPTRDPLAGPDPFDRLMNVYLASRAPVLYETLILVTQYLEGLNDGRHRGDDLVSLAVYELMETRPPFAEWRAALDRRTQGELGLTIPDGGEEDHDLDDVA